MSEPQNFSVSQMSCQHCIDAITSEVTKVDGVTGLSIDLDAKLVSVTGGDSQAIIAAIDEAGFDVD